MLGGIKPIYQKLEKHATIDPDFKPILESGINSIKALNNEIKNIQSETEPIVNSILQVVGSTTTLALASGSYSTVIGAENIKSIPRL